jgi:hypothetical protein
MLVSQSRSYVRTTLRRLTRRDVPRFYPHRRQDNPSRRGVMGGGTEDHPMFPSSTSERRISSSLDRIDRRPSTMIDLPPGGRPSISLHLDHTGSIGSNNNNDNNYAHNHNDETGTNLDSPVSPLSPSTSQYPHPPSNEAIEQIIANAMALAGSGPPSNSGPSSTPALPGQLPHPHQHPQPHQLQHQHHVTQPGGGGPPAFARSDGSFGSNNGGATRTDGYVLSDLGVRPGTGLRTGSDGYVGGTGTGYSGQLPPLGGIGAGVGTGTGTGAGAGVGGRLGGTIGTFRKSSWLRTWISCRHMNG